MSDSKLEYLNVYPLQLSFMHFPEFNVAYTSFLSTTIRSPKSVINLTSQMIPAQIRVDGFNGLRFTPIRKSKGCFTGTSYTCGSILNQNSKSVNPNKAVFTIDAKNSNILIVNKNACDLLGKMN